MKNLTPVGMKTVKTLHLIAVVMWLGGCLAMGLIALIPTDDPVSKLALLNVSELIDYAILIPGAVATVLTGAIYGIWSKWGFFRHTWLTVKWIVSIAIILIGTFFFHPFSLEMIDILQSPAPDATATNILAVDAAILRWCGLQAIALMLLIPVSVFKPWKRTPSPKA